MLRILTILVCALCTAEAALGLTDTARVKPDIRRAALHEDIDREQACILAKGSPEAPPILQTDDEDLRLLLTDVFTRKVDLMQDSLEATGRIDHRMKVKYLSGLRTMLSDFRTGCA